MKAFVKSATFRSLLVAVAFGACVSKTIANDGFPLRNGNFKWGAGFWLAPNRQDWGDRGGLQVQAKPDAHRNPRIKTAIQMYGGLYMSQDVRLVPGTYRFSVEVQVDPVDKGLVRLIGASDQFTIVQGPTERSTEVWKRIGVEFNASGDPSTQVKIQGVRGSFRVRDPRVDFVRLHSEAVASTTGQPIGRIVLPQEPHPAEAYAAWELQYFIWRMTGRFPGVEGRDSVSEGRVIRIGRAAPVALRSKLDGKNPESYIVAVENDSIILTGNSPRGTLYAAYDFLKTQGCRWFLPGTRGEVVPKRKALKLEVETRMEVPDWNVRGFLLHPTNYGPKGQIINVLGNGYFDWAVRNRINAVWHGSAQTHDLGDHRGGSHIQRLNHAWYSYLPKNPPKKWAALVNGKREFVHPSGRPNMVCTSNAEYRNRVVEQIIKYFNENPHAKVAACSADDEPTHWCTCKACRAQDSDEGKGLWELQDSGHPKLPMTDRALNFVNEVAARVSKVHPDKQIEMYAYASTGPPPVREQVHPNVLVKITYFQLSPARSLFENHPSTKGITASLNQWKKMGAEEFGLYDYGSFNNIDCPVFWFFLVNNHLRALNERWGIRHYLGETDNTIGPSMMLFNIRAASLWNRSTDYNEVLRDVCKHFYGVASQEMLNYYQHMHNQMLNFELPAGKPTPFVGDAVEYSLSAMVAGQKYLDAARKTALSDPQLISRIEIAEFGHALFTHYIATREANQVGKPASLESMRVATRSHSRVMKLWGKAGNFVIDRTRDSLNTWRPQPVLQRALFKFSVEWKFKTDPKKVGLKEKWFHRQTSPKEWSPIRTDNFWTRQGPWKNYRGVAWYRVKFTIPKASRAAVRAAMSSGKLGLYFGAVDGRARMFLDGKQFGEQMLDPGIMWNKSFVIDLPAWFDPDVEHELVIQVSKDRFAAGVWKPVVIGVVEKPPSANEAGK